MKRRLLFFLAAISLACPGAALFSSGANAYWHKPKLHRYHKKPVVIPPLHHANPYRATGPSPWCKSHPKKCHPRKTQDPAVNSSREHCLDSKGNGDGYVSGWEMDKFGPMCP